MFIKQLLYQILTGFYFFAIRIAALKNPKAKAFINGRKHLFEKLAAQQNNLKNCVWFHCASFGEFEQARPLIELIKSKHPNKKILLTFFSPSGYEVKKEYPLADYICYLPIDTQKNAKLFLKLVQPQLVIFVKYEWWYFMLKEISNANVPLYNIASLFNKQQVFFKFYGGLHRTMLHFCESIFVQNQSSKNLLRQIEINNVEVAGDTRFDTVIKNLKNKKLLPKIEQFKAGQNLIIGGSTYPTEDDFLIQAINKNLISNCKYLIVPHDIDKAYCKNLKAKINVPSLLYSEIENQNLNDINVIIIDGVGLLSNLYQYANVALIGGGFNKGIHNILEAVVFGVPVLFGPKYKKAQEAKDLITQKLTTSVNYYDEFEVCIKSLLTDEAKYHLIKKQLQLYVEQNVGATQKIYEYIFS